MWKYFKIVFGAGLAAFLLYLLFLALRGAVREILGYREERQ